MDAAQYIVALRPIAVELVDQTMIGLAAEIPIFKPTLSSFLRGDPEALLVVEFAESDDENRKRLSSLTRLLGNLGFGWDRQGRKMGRRGRSARSGPADVDRRNARGGLNIMMSMKDARKPVSFVEDCAVPLPHLAEYAARLTEVFEKHGTRGTWYTHASEGACTSGPCSI
jgi:FAD/FMN-containing dehydrogenase